MSKYLVVVLLLVFSPPRPPPHFEQVIEEPQHCSVDSCHTLLVGRNYQEMTFVL
jgi:hypothetical protein